MPDQYQVARERYARDRQFAEDRVKRMLNAKTLTPKEAKDRLALIRTMEKTKLDALALLKEKREQKEEQRRFKEQRRIQREKERLDRDIAKQTIQAAKSSSKSKKVLAEITPEEQRLINYNRLVSRVGKERADELMPALSIDPGADNDIGDTTYVPSEDEAIRLAHREKLQKELDRSTNE